MRRRVPAKAGAAVTGVALAGVAGWAFVGRSTDGGQAAVAPITTSTAKVVRADIADRRQVDGKLSYAGTYEVIAAGPGTLTRLPATGQTVERGEAAYEVGGSPVVLMYGRRPPWREFRSGMTNGPDVRQLESNLKALGYGAGMTVDKHFSLATYWAVRAWQDDAGLPVTGTVPLGQVVFTPTAVRISEHDLKLGMQVQPGTRVAHGTGDRRAVTVELSPTELPQVREGDKVVVTLPDGSNREGRITAIGAVATNPASTGDQGPGGQDQQSTAPVTVTVAGKIRGFLDQATVQVAITQELREHVLAVPVTALLGVPGGKYEVVVVAGATSRKVPVSTGLFDDIAGLVEVEGPGLAEGQQVEVPRAGA